MEQSNIPATPHERLDFHALAQDRLNNALAAVSLGLQGLERAQTAEEQSEKLRLAWRGYHQMKRAVDKLLEETRLEKEGSQDKE